MKRQLTVEFGALDSGENHLRVENPVEYRVQTSIMDARRLEEDFPNVAFTFLPYEGTRSLLSGGRCSNIGPSRLLESIDIYNKEGFPFSVPFNGGLRFRDVDLNMKSTRFHTEMKVLHALTKNATKYGVENHVTIFHDSLLRVVREKFPDLKATASSIRFLGGRRGNFEGVDEYRRAFDDFDLVVPLNQHTTWGFLQQFRDRVEQMLVFLNLDCCRSDVRTCFRHYCKLEEEIAGSCSALVGMGGGIPSNDEIDYIDSPILSEVGDACTNSCHHRNACLMERDDLNTLTGAGVTKFKIPRRSTFYPLRGDNLRRLAHMFNHVSNA